MPGIIFKYYKRIKSLPFFIHNDIKADFIFVLGILFFFVLAEDLGSELASQKDEVSYLVATLTESVDSISLKTAEPLTYTPELIFFLETEDVFISKNHKHTFHSGRSPPVSVI